MSLESLRTLFHRARLYVVTATRSRAKLATVSSGHCCAFSSLKRGRRLRKFRRSLRRAW